MLARMSTAMTMKEKGGGGDESVMVTGQWRWRQMAAVTLAETYPAPK